MLGFPIRTPSDPRSVGSSPRHIAASHVLHRLLMPRHPPCALKHLQHKKPEKEKEIAHQTHTTTPQPLNETRVFLYARCSQPLSTNQTPHPTTKAGQQQTPSEHQNNAWSLAADPHTPPSMRSQGLLSQSPIVCPAVPSPAKGTHVCCVHQTRLHYRGRAIQRIVSQHRTPTRCGRGELSWCSLERR